jgi:hypothetical protein
MKWDLGLIVFDFSGKFSGISCFWKLYGRHSFNGNHVIHFFTSPTYVIKKLQLRRVLLAFSWRKKFIQNTLGSHFIFCCHWDNLLKVRLKYDKHQFIDMILLKHCTYSVIRTRIYVCFSHLFIFISTFLFFPLLKSSFIPLWLFLGTCLLLRWVRRMRYCA